LEAAKVAKPLPEVNPEDLGEFGRKLLEEGASPYMAKFLEDLQPVDQ
jgi:hypothetical protein